MGREKTFTHFNRHCTRKIFKNYGDLAELIMLTKYYIPVLDIPDYSALGLPAKEITLLQSKIVNDFAKQVGRKRADRPKLYGLILENMSVKSRDKVSRSKFMRYGTMQPIQKNCGKQ
jgi:hypothetical protein